MASFPNKANQPSNSCKIELETPPESRVHPQSPFLSTFTSSLLHPRCHHRTRLAHSHTFFIPHLPSFISRPPSVPHPVPPSTSSSTLSSLRPLINQFLLTNPSITILSTRTGLCLNPISAQFFYTKTIQHHPSSPSATNTLFSPSPHLTLVNFDSI